MRNIIASYTNSYGEEFFTMAKAEYLTPELVAEMHSKIEDNSGDGPRIEDINFFYCEPIRVSTQIVIE